MFQYFKTVVVILKLIKKVGTSCPEMPTMQLGQLEQHRGRISKFYVVADSVFYVFATI